jgi:hypothetical protein
MSRTPILQLCWDVADEVGLSRPDTLFAPYNEGDTSDAKLRRALTKASRFVHRYWQWPVVTAEASFVAGPNGLQAGALPTDFDRMVKNSMVDQFGRPVTLALRPPVLIQGQTTSLAPVAVIRGATLAFWSPSTNSTVQFSYVRDVIAEGLITPATATKPEVIGLKPAFSADTDVCILDDEIMHLAIVWTLLHRDGNQTNEDYAAFVGALHERMNHESDDIVVDLGAGPNAHDPLASYPRTPWGL